MNPGILTGLLGVEFSAHRFNEAGAMNPGILLRGISMVLAFVVLQ